MTKTKEPVCGMEVDGKKARDLVLGNMLQAVRMLKESRSFALLIPEVRTNLVYALPDAKSKEDVAGIDGRITVVNGFPKASGFPQFGASSHMARLILEIMKVNPEMRAGINFIYNNDFGKWLKEYCKENNLLLGCVDRSKEPEERKQKEGDSMVWKVAEVIRSVNGRVPDIAYETGAVGKEPVSVLIGKSAVEIVERVIKLGEDYVKNR